MFGPDAPLPPSVKTDSRLARPRERGLASPHAARRSTISSGSTTATWPLVDHEIGLLRKHLEKLGVWDRTVVMITADHGEAMYEHGFIGHNEQVYEESVRIPLILRFPPGTVPGGRRVDALTGLLDVAPDHRGRPRDPAGAHAHVPRPQPAVRRRGRARHAPGGGAVPHGGLAAAIRAGRARATSTSTTPATATSRCTTWRGIPASAPTSLHAEPVQAAYGRQRLFAALLALPGRSGASATGWTVPADQREALRALGYVQ